MTILSGLADGRPFRKFLETASEEGRRILVSATILIIFELVRCEKFEPQDSQLSSIMQIFEQRPATELLCVEQVDIREACWEIYE